MASKALPRFVEHERREIGRRDVSGRTNGSQCCLRDQSSSSGDVQDPHAWPKASSSEQRGNEPDSYMAAKSLIITLGRTLAVDELVFHRMCSIQFDVY